MLRRKVHPHGVFLSLKLNDAANYRSEAVSLHGLPRGRTFGALSFELLSPRPCQLFPPRTLLLTSQTSSSSVSVRPSSAAWRRSIGGQWQRVTIRRVQRFPNREDDHAKLESGLSVNWVVATLRPACASAQSSSAGGRRPPKCNRLTRTTSSVWRALG